MKMKTSKINLKDNKIVSVHLHVVFYQEEADGSQAMEKEEI
jgi:hypothetical protein